MRARIALFMLLLTCAAVTATDTDRGRIEIIRDDYGMPHIFAATAEGAAFAIGYAQAEDRLEELLKNYRRAEGTMSEAFGPEWLEHDYRQRLWDHRGAAEAAYPKLSAVVRSHVDAFQAGVKRYLDEHPSEVPAWAPVLKPWQPLAVARYLTWAYTEGDLNGDLGRAGLKVDPGAYRGSNAMIVGASRSSAGGPIAIIDPQLYWYAEYRLYSMAVYAGDLAFTGSAIVGTPYPFVGHTRYASIAMTSGGPDTADAFEEEIADGKYRFKGAWLPITVREEKVGEHTIRIESTRHGPIVVRDKTKAYAAAIAYRDAPSPLEELWGMLNAKNLADMQRALGLLALPPQNTLIATVQGDAYYLRNGRVPVRPATCDPSRPMPGAEGRCEWDGMTKLDDLVQLSNPREDYLQNCNSSPEWVVANSPLTRERYKDRPYVFNATNDPLGPRASMILDALDHAKTMSLDQALELAVLSKVYKSEAWQARVRRAMPEPDAFTRTILEWDGYAKADSRGALAFYLFKLTLGAAGRYTSPPEGLMDREIAQVLQQAAARLARDYPADATYGTVFRVGRIDGGRTFPVGGGTLHEAGMVTPRTVHFRKIGNEMVAEGGQTATQVVVLQNPPKSFIATSLGQSDRKDSPHFDDQAEKLFSRSRLRSTYFLDRAELEKRKTTQTVLHR